MKDVIYLKDVKKDDIKKKKEKRKNMVEIEHYKEIYKVVEKYDPVGIAESWGQGDEYKYETIDIANRASVLSKKELAEYIYNVFVFWNTEIPLKKDKSIYTQMAKEIKAIVGDKVE